jgi:hypothetical protein
VRQADIQVLSDEGKVLHTDRADLSSQVELGKVATRLADRLGESPEKLREHLENGWIEALNRDRERLREEAAAESGDAESTGLPDGCPWRAVDVPKGYRITPDGCVLDESGESGSRLLSRGPVWVEAYARDYRCDAWGYLLAWRDRDGQLHRRAFPAECFHEHTSSLVTTELYLTLLKTRFLF